MKVKDCGSGADMGEEGCGRAAHIIMRQSVDFGITCTYYGDSAQSTT